MISVKPWRPDAVARLLLSVMTCFLGGALLESVLHYTDAASTAGGKWFYAAAAVAFGFLAGGLLLLQRPWRPENVVRRLLGALCCLYGCFIIGAWVQTRVETGDVLTQHVIVSSLSVQGAALILVSRLLREHGMLGTPLGCAPTRGAPWCLGRSPRALFLPVGRELQRASVFALDHLAGLGLKPEVQPAVKVIQQAVPWPSRTALGLVTVLLAPLGEEMLFRGILYPASSRRAFRAWRSGAPPCCSPASHFNLVTFLPLSSWHWSWQLLYEWTDNLLAPIAAHSLFNALNFGALPAVRAPWRNHERVRSDRPADALAADQQIGGGRRRATIAPCWTSACPTACCCSRPTPWWRASISPRQRRRKRSGTRHWAAA